MVLASSSALLLLVVLFACLHSFVLNHVGYFKPHIELAGDGYPRTSGAAGAPFESEVLTDEMECLREILPLGESALLQHLSDFRHNLFVAAHAYWRRNDDRSILRFLGNRLNRGEHFLS